MINLTRRLLSPCSTTLRSLNLGFARNLASSSKIQNQKDDVPNNVDVLIMGGGIIGASIAYHLKSQAPSNYNVAMVERDPTFTQASAPLSCGGIRQQWQHPENVLVTMYGTEFLRNAKRNLSTPGGDPPELNFRENGYLFLANEEQAEKMIESNKMQNEMGAKVQLLTAEQIKQKYPHVNTDGIALGSYGVQNEGWFDPWALLIGLRAKAQSLDVKMVHGNIEDFSIRTLRDDLTGEKLEQCNFANIRDSDGKLKQIQFTLGVVCCGADSGIIAKKLGYGQKQGVRSVELPVERRKRYVYSIHCKDGPSQDYPFLIDTPGEFCRPEGGHFICGRSPIPEDEPSVDNLDCDFDYFENSVLPDLANRVPAFEAIKLKGGWAGYYDYNRLDQQAIIGFDPYYQNLIWATGFSGHGLQMAPAVGRAVTELIAYQQYKTIDLSAFGWNRVLKNEPLAQDNIV